MTKVKCVVKECEYWTEGNGCSADEITVSYNFIAGARGLESKEGPKYEVNQNYETLCETFEPKES